MPSSLIDATDVLNDFVDSYTADEDFDIEFYEENEDE